MNEKLIVYLDMNSLEEIILFDDIYPNLNKIFGSKNCDFYIDISEEDLDNLLIDSESNLRMFLNGNNLPEPKAAQKAFESFYNNEEIQMHNGRVYYIVRKEPEEIKEIENSYGIFINSNKSINDNLFNFKFKRGFDKGEKISGNDNGWKNLLNDFVFPPSNAMIISDDHLFDNEKWGKNVGLCNILDFIGIALPKHLDVPYHLLLMCSAPPKSQEKADEMISSINEYIQNKSLDYQVNLYVVFSNAIHKRIIISNYYILVCDKGFKIFNPNSNIIYDDNDINISPIFEDLEFRGESNLEMSIRRMKKMKKICDEVKAQVEGKINDKNKRIISYSNNSIEFNRLFL